MLCLGVEHKEKTYDSLTNTGGNLYKTY